MTRQTYDPEIHDEISLRSLVEVLWQGRVLVGGVALACFLAGVAYAFLAPEIFRSEALVQPQEASGAGNLSGVLNQFGGLADLAGVSVGGGTERAVALATLKSRTVIDGFIRDNGVMQRMYASEWDADAKAWRESDPARAPNLWKAYEEFTEDILVVSEDKASGLVTVAIEWRDPAEAQHWATDLIGRTNEHLKRRAIEDGERNLAFLQAQLDTIGQVELRQALYSLVEAELKKVMLAKGGGEFALRTIDAAPMPLESERPKRLLVIVLGFMFGLVVGAICVFFRQEWQRGRAA